MAMSQESKRKCGSVSFALFIAQLICGALGVFVALAAGGGGHPPSGIIILIFFAFGVACLAPIGILLGALGNPSMIGKSLIGLAGNSALSLVVFWFLRHI